jgi:DNA repair protein RecO (recombination protein O)
MFRSLTVEGFILSTERMGEIHKQVLIFTGDRGIMSAIAHGAMKTTGKLKSHTELFLHCRFFLYHEPIKDSYKITDAECISSFPHLRLSLVRFYAASLFAEIVMKSFAGGEANKALFELYSETFTLLDAIDEGKVHYLVIQFILRFLHLTGFQMETDGCAACGRVVGEKEGLFFLRRGRGFVCAACRKEAGIEFSPGARAYLKKTLPLAPAGACKIELAANTLIALKTLVYLLVQESIEKELNSLAVGKGIL